jgi:hypothetical protein
MGVLQLGSVLASVSVVAAVQGTFKIESPFGKPVAGFELCVVADATPETCSGTATTTDENGRAVLEVDSNSSYIVKGRKSPTYQDLYIFGESAPADFEYISYMGTKSEAVILAGLIKQPYNASLGYIVAGMDVVINSTDLEPAVGASAAVTGIAGGTPFVFNAIGLPTDGNSVTRRGSSFVTWPNMQPNQQGLVHVTPPENMDCEVSPGIKPPGVQSKSREQPIRVFADAVTVVSFICQ